MGAEKAAPIWEQTKKVTSDTYEATGPTRAQLYDMVTKLLIFTSSHVNPFSLVC